MNKKDIYGWVALSDLIHDGAEGCTLTLRWIPQKDGSSAKHNPEEPDEKSDVIITSDGTADAYRGRTEVWFRGERITYQTDHLRPTIGLLEDAQQILTEKAVAVFYRKLAELKEKFYKRGEPARGADFEWEVMTLENDLNNRFPGYSEAIYKLKGWETFFQDDKGKEEE